MKRQLLLLLLLLLLSVGFLSFTAQGIENPAYQFYLVDETGNENPLYDTARKPYPIAAGKTYHFIVKAVDADGSQSVLSPNTYLSKCYAPEEGQLAEQGGAALDENDYFALPQDAHGFSLTPLLAGDDAVEVTLFSPDGEEELVTLYLHVVEKSGQNGLAFYIRQGDSAFRVDNTSPQKPYKVYLDEQPEILLYREEGGVRQPVNYDGLLRLKDPDKGAWISEENGNACFLQFEHGTRKDGVVEITYEGPAEKASLYLTVWHPLDLKPMHYIEEAFSVGMEEVPKTTAKKPYVLQKRQGFGLQGGGEMLSNPGQHVILEDPDSCFLLEKTADRFYLVPQRPGTAELFVYGTVKKLYLKADPTDIPNPPIPPEPSEEPLLIYGWRQKAPLSPSKLIWGTTKCVVKSQSGSFSDPDLQNVRGKVTSSDEAVAKILYDEEQDDTFYIVPTGFGSARILYEGEGASAEAQIVIGGELHFTANGRPFYGTKENPFPLLSAAGIQVKEKPDKIWKKFSSSDPSVVAIEDIMASFVNFIPLRAGTAEITYTDGCFTKTFTIKADPDSYPEERLNEVGFYRWVGATPIRAKNVSLAVDGAPMEFFVQAEQADYIQTALLSADRIQYSQQGIVELIPVTSKGEDFTEFYLRAKKPGTVTISCPLESGQTVSMQVSVTAPGSRYDFVFADPAQESGYSLWGGTQGTEAFFSGEQVMNRQILFAQIEGNEVLPLPYPADFSVEADADAYSLFQQGTEWWRMADASTEGQFHLTLTGTPPGENSPRTWRKTLKVNSFLQVTEPTVAAINRAIAQAPAEAGKEVVILLPPGEIPGEEHDWIRLTKPVILAGQEDTVLHSDIQVICEKDGARLQNVIQRDAGGESRVWHRPYSGQCAQTPAVPLIGIWGSGQVTLQNCDIEGFGVGISLAGSRVRFEKSNRIAGCQSVGLCIQPMASRRAYASGILFEKNMQAIQIASGNSKDPYFYRFVNNNFLGNHINILNKQPDVTEGPPIIEQPDFSGNYFDGGKSLGGVVDYPSYTSPVPITREGAQPNENLRLTASPQGELSQLKMLNFELPAPLDAANFAQSKDGVHIEVKELLSDTVGIAENTRTVLIWDFSPAPQSSGVFLPYAKTDERFAEEAARYGVTNYQGVSFSHDGRLPLEGAQVRVRKYRDFSGDTLFVYRITDGGLQQIAAVKNDSSEYVCFFLDSCSDYFITDTQVIEAENAATETARPSGGGDSETVSASTYYSAGEITRRFQGSAETVSLDVSVKTRVSGELFQKLREHPEKTVLLKGDGYAWKFSGKDLKPGAEKLLFFDTRISRQSPHIEKLRRAAGTNNFSSVYFYHTGLLPGKALVSVSSKEPGPLSLYYFHPDTNRLEEVQASLPVVEERVSFELTHCSDYLLLPDSVQVPLEPVKILPNTGAWDSSFPLDK